MQQIALGSPGLTRLSRSSTVEPSLSQLANSPIIAARFKYFQHLPGMKRLITLPEVIIRGSRTKHANTQSKQYNIFVSISIGRSKRLSIMMKSSSQQPLKIEGHKISLDERGRVEGLPRILVRGQSIPNFRVAGESSTSRYHKEKSDIVADSQREDIVSSRFLIRDVVRNIAQRRVNWHRRSKHFWSASHLIVSILCP